MTAWMMALLIFLATVAVIGAGAMVVRDLRASRTAAADVAAQPVRLQRIRTPELAAGFSISGFDRWFVQLLRDAGFDWNATMTALLLILWGALCGFALFFFDDRVEPAVFAGLIAMILPMVYFSFIRAGASPSCKSNCPRPWTRWPEAFGPARRSNRASRFWGSTRRNRWPGSSAGAPGSWKWVWACPP
jgi:hypothetical protein